MTEAIGDPAATIRGRSPFLPMALLATALVVGLAFQTWSLVAERSQLALANATQEPPTVQARKLRAALDTLAVSTQRLAAEGSVSARTVVEELARRGVTINPAGAASSPK
jgi:hypothetical protein